jgi:hypothetical protein
VAGSLTTLPRMEGKFLLVEIKVPLGRRKNGKATSQVTIGSNGRKCGTPSGPVKKPLSFGRYGTRRSRLMNGELGLPRHLSQSNAYFVSPTLASRSSTNFGIASKLGERGGGPPTLCTSFAE